MDMDEEEVSKELTILLSQLNKGDRVDMGQVVHGLSDVERDIFMEALNQKGLRDKKYADLLKEKDQMIKTLKEIYGQPMSEWTW